MFDTTGEQHTTEPATPSCDWLWVFIQIDIHKTAKNTLGFLFEHERNNVQLLRDDATARLHRLRNAPRTSAHQTYAPW